MKINKLKNDAEQAVTSGNVESVRALILDTLRTDAGRASALDIITKVLKTMPDIFVADDGKLPFLKKECWTDQYAERLEEACSLNFSREKVLHYVEVMSELKRNHRNHRNVATEQQRDDHAAALFEVADTFIES